MGSSFTNQEIQIIENIKTGCEELIKFILSERLESPERYVKLSSHKKHKSFVRIYAIFEVIRIINKGNNKVFRPIDLRNELPNNYKDIRYSALSDILKSLLKMKFIIKAPELSIKKHRGHPIVSSDNSRDNTNIPGLKSYYKVSPLLESTTKILDEQEANESIYNHLLETGLLIKLYEKTALTVIRSFKENDYDYALNIRKTVKLPQSETKTESQFLEQFKRTIEVYNMMNDDEKLKRVKEWAKTFVVKQHPIEFKEIYQLGMICYNMISNSIKLTS